MRPYVAALAVLIAFPGAAAAQTAAKPFYGELRSGVAIATDADIDISGLPDTELSLEPGWLVDLAFGYGHASGLRGEVALGIRRNDFDEIDVSGVGSADVNGDMSAFTVMANGYYDLSMGALGTGGDVGSRFKLFLGGGIGMAVLDVDGDLGDESDTTFAFQAIGGLSYAITEDWAATLTYTYFSAVEPEFDGTESEYDSHNIMAGIRYSF